MKIHISAIVDMNWTTHMWTKCLFNFFIIDLILNFKIIFPKIFTFTCHCLLKCSCMSTTCHLWLELDTGLHFHRPEQCVAHVDTWKTIIISIMGHYIQLLDILFTHSDKQQVIATFIFRAHLYSIVMVSWQAQLITIYLTQFNFCKHRSIPFFMSGTNSRGWWCRQGKNPFPPAS